ncbi:hypothetical protein NicSoilC12_30370 [Arthrobacter sp. NicSoilC12]|nr:hypothetical protein NicSoilC12_30370 [Arthrobacter sp. NicSoilC12]
MEARTAALRVRLTADYAHATRFLAPPAPSPRDRAVQEMALVAEVACVLTVSERAAAALLSESRALSTALPLTLAALQAGTISWAHARIIVDETASLDAAGAAGLEAHFLDAEAPNPARGCPAGDLVPSRFRAKARAWRERHHPAGIEERHATSAADRRVEYTPDRDGMAWLSAHLPADPAGIWDRTTAAARALQGPDEPRTLAQLRADITATWLLTTGTRHRRNKRRNGRNGQTGGGSSCGCRWVCSGPAGAGPGHRPGPGPARRHRRTGRPGRVRADPALDGPPPDRRRRRFLPPGPDRPPGRRPAGNRPDQLPAHDGPAPLAPAPRRPMPVPGCANHSLDNEADHLLAWADGGTTGISNLGQPCPKHHRLKHSAWTPARASTDHPPGWTSPSGRYYPSEHQDWEPPHWPEAWLPTSRPRTTPARNPTPTQAPIKTSPRIRTQPAPGPLPGLAPIHRGHPLPEADTDDPYWPAAPADPYSEWLLLQCA